MVMHVRGSPIGYTSVLIAVVASMGGFLFGYDTGQISGILVYEDFKARFATETDPMTGEPAFNTYLEGCITGFLSIGTAIGAILGAPAADKLGRRLAMQVEVLVFCIGVIIQVTSFEAWYQVAIGRLVTGLGIGALSAAVPLYQSETVPRQIRGSLVATYQLFITFGIFIAYCFALGTRELDPSSASWRVLIVLGIPFSLILAIGIQFCPESPRWLATRGRLDEAYNALALVRGCSPKESNPWVEQEYADILAGIERDRHLGESKWIDCFKKADKTRYRTILGIVLQAGQQLTGANYFFYYGTQIFTSAGLSDQFVTQLILGGVNFACTFAGLYILERFGRRNPLIVGAAGMVVFLVVFATAGTAGDSTTYGIGVTQIVAAVFFIMFYATTWGPGIWLFVGESFNMRTRAKQASLATLSNWIWNFLIGFFSPVIAADISFKYGYVFAGAGVLNCLIAIFFVRETRDLTLEQVNMMYVSGVPAWRSASWVPEGFTSRGETKEVMDEDNVTKVSDPRPEWKSQPDPVTGEETDKARKHPVKGATQEA